MATDALPHTVMQLEQLLAKQPKRPDKSVLLSIFDIPASTLAASLNFNTALRDRRRLAGKQPVAVANGTLPLSPPDAEREDGSSGSESEGESDAGSEDDEGGLDAMEGEEEGDMESAPVDPWRALYELVASPNRLWTVIILRSGRFAGAVFEGKVAIEHKTLRRYTIRAKRGGAQSSYDTAGRRPKSMGAQLRRHGEQALKEEVRALLQAWRPFLEGSCAVLLSVPKTMRSVIYEEAQGRSPVMVKGDPRVRSIPFVVGKPTFAEVSAAHWRVTSIAFRPADEEPSSDGSSDRRTAAVEDSTSICASADRAKTQASGGSRAGAASAAPSAAEPVELPPCAPLQRLVDACRSGDAAAAAEALASCARDDEGGPWDPVQLVSMPEGLSTLATSLHIASEAGHAKLVSLLLEAGADPCKKDVRLRVPFFLAQDKEVRDAFRRHRASAEDALDWEAAGVPAALTDDMERLRKEKEKEKRKRAKERKKERAAEEQAEKAIKAAEEEVEKARLAVEQQIAMRVMQARRAELLKCGGCGKLVTDPCPLHVFDQRCCSSACIQKCLKRQGRDCQVINKTITLEGSGTHTRRRVGAQQRVGSGVAPQRSKATWFFGDRTVYLRVNAMNLTGLASAFIAFGYTLVKLLHLFVGWGANACTGLRWPPYRALGILLTVTNWIVFIVVTFKRTGGAEDQFGAQRCVFKFEETTNDLKWILQFINHIVFTSMFVYPLVTVSTLFTLVVMIMVFVDYSNPSLEVPITSLAILDNGITLWSICFANGGAASVKDSPKCINTNHAPTASTIEDNGMTLGSICFANGGASAAWERSMNAPDPGPPVTLSSGGPALSLGDQETWPTLSPSRASQLENGSVSMVATLNDVRCSQCGLKPHRHSHGRAPRSGSGKEPSS
ncbi:hypothetical protein JKP88DRAFT_262073 [Tribonema minus]|uniref:VLRF1 domain-containing protein n=1 Tax=Tribonema minus TaxID=303371 RepID=A0A836CLF2_9STRA|nr:hypothetical protein JKP88DRAFT_262073 [Tribonema minus]